MPKKEFLILDNLEHFLKSATALPVDREYVVKTLFDLLRFIDKKSFPELISLLSLIQTAKDFDILFDKIALFDNELNRGLK